MYVPIGSDFEVSIFGSGVDVGLAVKTLGGCREGEGEGEGGLHESGSSISVRERQCV